MRITFHIGLPKPGTTRLQRHLFGNRPSLEEAGLDYCWDLCDLGHYSKAPAHHAVAVYRCAPHWRRYAQLDDAAIAARLGNSGEVLLSSEWFQVGAQESVARLAEALELPVDRRVVLVVRDELERVCSHWMQRVKGGRDFWSLRSYYERSYKPARMPLSRVMARWIDAEFCPAVISYDYLKAADDFTLKFLRLLYPSIPVSEEWRRFGKNNVSPPSEHVAGYQQLCGVPYGSSIGQRLRQRMSFSTRTKVHDSLCRWSGIMRFLDMGRHGDDMAFVRLDLALLPPINDVHEFMLHPLPADAGR